MAIKTIIAIILCLASCSFVSLQDSKITEVVTATEVIETVEPTEIVEYEVVEEAEPTETMECETIETVKPTEAIESTETEQHIVTAPPAHETPDVWVEYESPVAPAEIQPVVEPSVEGIWTPPLL